MSTIKSKSEVAQERNLGGKRCVRFPISTTNEYDRKISRLSISCDLSKSEMVDQLLRISLDSPNVVEWLQDRFNKVEEYRVKPTIINGKVYY